MEPEVWLRREVRCSSHSEVIHLPRHILDNIHNPKGVQKPFLERLAVLDGRMSLGQQIIHIGNNQFFRLDGVNNRLNRWWRWMCGYQDVGL